MENIASAKNAILIKQKSYYQKKLFGVLTQLKSLLQKICMIGKRKQIKYFSYAFVIHKSPPSNARDTVQCIDLEHKGGNRWE